MRWEVIVLQLQLQLHRRRPWYVSVHQSRTDVIAFRHLCFFFSLRARCACAICLSGSAAAAMAFFRCVFDVVFRYVLPLLPLPPVPLDPDMIEADAIGEWISLFHNHNNKFDNTMGPYDMWCNDDDDDHMTCHSWNECQPLFKKNENETNGCPKTWS